MKLPAHVIQRLLQGPFRDALSSAFRCVLVCSILCAGVQLAHAQATQVVDHTADKPGSISGSLLPASNAKASITNVKVTIVETGDLAGVDREGRYEFPSVPPGT